MQGAPSASVSVSDSQAPALLAAARRMCRVWYSGAVVEHTPTATYHGQKPPNAAEVLPSSLPQGYAVAKTSTNRFLQPTWSTALGPVWLNAETRGASRDRFCTLLLSAYPSL